MTRPSPVMRRRLCLATLAAAWPAWSLAQPVADAAADLKVVLSDGRQRHFTLAELQALPAETAPARLRDRAPSEVRGVSVTTLLRLTGLDLTQNLGGGQVVSQALIARAADGYRAVFALAEIDPHFGHPPVMVNWSNPDGSTLPARVGPLQLIQTGETRPGRWIRQLVSLEVKAL